MDKVSKLSKSKYKILVKFENGSEIKADPMCWVLYIPSPRTYWYYSDLSQVFSEILNLRIKELAGLDSRHNLESLAQAIHQATKEINHIISTLTTIKISEQSRLDLQEHPLEKKDD